jgi:hypothetical protein
MEDSCKHGHLNMSGAAQAYGALTPHFVDRSRLHAEQIIH